MTVVVDTGVLYAYLNAKDTEHQRAVQAMERILSREWGTPLGPDTVLVEGMNLIKRKYPVRAVTQEYARWFWGSDTEDPVLHLVMTDRDTLRAAQAVFFRQHKYGLSFTDCTLIAHAERLGAELATFDGHLKWHAGGVDI